MKEFNYPQRELSLNVSTGGYLKVTLVVGGKTKSINSHILVAEAFLGKRPEAWSCAIATAFRQITVWKTLGGIRTLRTISTGNDTELCRRGKSILWQK